LRIAYPEEQPSMLSITKWGGIFRVWNIIEMLQIEVGEGNEESRMKYCSANPD